MTNVTASLRNGAIDLGFNSRDAEGTSVHSNTTAGGRLQSRVMQSRPNRNNQKLQSQQEMKHVSPRKSVRTEGPLMVDAKDITFKSSQLENTPPLNNMKDGGAAKNRRKSKFVEKEENQFTPSKHND